MRKMRQNNCNLMVNYNLRNFFLINLFRHLKLNKKDDEKIIIVCSANNCWSINS
jgi:hypothetical protein